jgi:hypothetical protein
VFVNPAADRRRNPEGFYTGDYLNSLWRPALQKAKLEHIKLENAERHSRIMQAIEDGWTLEEIRALVRHSDYTYLLEYAKAGAQVLRNRMQGKVKSITGQRESAQ